MTQESRVSGRMPFSCHALFPIITQSIRSSKSSRSAARSANAHQTRTRFVHTKHNRANSWTRSHQTNPWSMVLTNHDFRVTDRGSSPPREISSCCPQTLPALDESSPSHFESCRRHPHEENKIDFTTMGAKLGSKIMPQQFLFPCPPPLLSPSLPLSMSPSSVVPIRLIDLHSRPQTPDPRT
jgi:hypothetical protein